ncbi:ABC transporter permease [Alkalibacter saccharofermentans]|uniref:Tungstate transport system permease protein n=1 Tax=Alkalibacter saccharofermentans DSM 14828 TaxID=1120975 RepID=A0A1M4TNN3_9FIRM|nr:ABC transporter permease [Alkalibacter saccharofermentans]SHE45986.1 tungstate transport system permease protein [Alkalibacter saccharofermentans DSM 14828]
MVSGIADGFAEAIRLLGAFDGEIYSIIGLSLFVSLSSTLLSTVIALPVGVYVASNRFKGKKIVVRIINTFMGIPPVVAGLIVYLMLTRTGPFGSYRLLFSIYAMVIAQILIVTPIITGLTISAVHLKVKAVKDTCHGLGIGKFKTVLLLLNECKYPIVSAIMAGYGRAISEVGAIMLVGGNIQFRTRVMTTAIVLETGKGNYGKALALGMTLLLVSFGINWVVSSIQEGRSYESRNQEG